MAVGPQQDVDTVTVNIIIMMLIHQQSHTRDGASCCQGLLMTEASHWLMAARDFGHVSAHDVFYRGSLGLQRALYLEATLNLPPGHTVTPSGFLLNMFPLVPPQMYVFSKDTDKVVKRSRAASLPDDRTVSLQRLIKLTACL